MYIYMCVYIYIYICWLTIVEGDPKLLCQGVGDDATPFLGLLHLPLIFTL